jgi:hypothetical protein
MREAHEESKASPNAGYPTDAHGTRIADDWLPSAAARDVLAGHAPIVHATNPNRRVPIDRKEIVRSL